MDADTFLPDHHGADLGIGGKFDQMIDRIAAQDLDALALHDFRDRGAELHDGLSLWAAGRFGPAICTSWNRIFPSGKARAALARGSADMRFAACRPKTRVKATARRGGLPRFAAAAEHGRHQPPSGRAHMPSYDDRWRARLGGARLVDLVAQEADIVLSRFTLLRGHVRLLRKTPIRQPWRGSAQSMVNFPSRMNTGAGAGLINRSSCSSKPLQSFQSSRPSHSN